MGAPTRPPAAGRSIVASLALTALAIDSLRADALVVATLKGPDGLQLAPGADEVDRALAGRLHEALTALGATGAEDEVVTLASLGAFGVPVVAAAGLGAAPTGGSSISDEAVRRAAGAASRALAG